MLSMEYSKYVKYRNVLTSSINIIFSFLLILIFFKLSLAPLLKILTILALMFPIRSLLILTVNNLCKNIMYYKKENILQNDISILEGISDEYQYTIETGHKRVDISVVNISEEIICKYNEVDVPKWIDVKISDDTNVSRFDFLETRDPKDINKSNPVPPNCIFLYPGVIYKAYKT